LIYSNSQLLSIINPQFTIIYFLLLPFHFLLVPNLQQSIVNRKLTIFVNFVVKNSVVYPLTFFLFPPTI